MAAFADSGADIVFIDALESREEMRAFCASGGAARTVPKVPFLNNSSLSPLADMPSSAFPLIPFFKFPKSYIINALQSRNAEMCKEC